MIVMIEGHREGMNKYIDLLKNGGFPVSDVMVDDKGDIYFKVENPTLEVVMNIEECLGYSLILGGGEIIIYDDYNE